jgi:26S proteasome regulatory subunit N7
VLVFSQIAIFLSFQDAAVEAIRKTMEKTVGLGNRMDLIFHNIRLGLFYTDYSKLLNPSHHKGVQSGLYKSLPFSLQEIIQSNLQRANTMMEEGGDWDRRNRLKVYEGLYSMSIRDFSKAANLFLETVSTFTR